MEEEKTSYTSEDKNCTHCGGNLSSHSVGDYAVKIWCDNCGSNNPSSPPKVTIN